MKKILIAFFAFACTSVNAQSYKETFDSNNMGWTETSTKQGEAVIKDGVMHMVGTKAGGNTYFGYKAPSFIETHCYSGIDVAKNFEIKCDAIAKKISDDGCIGIVLDYMDDGNFIAFVIGKDEAYLIRYHNGDPIGYIRNRLKTEKKKAALSLSIKSTYQKLQFYVNNMLAVEARFLPLTSNGFGFYVLGEQTVDFDNVEFIQ